MISRIAPLVSILLLAGCVQIRSPGAAAPTAVPAESQEESPDSAAGAAPPPSAPAAPAPGGPAEGPAAVTSIAAAAPAEGPAAAPSARPEPPPLTLAEARRQVSRLLVPGLAPVSTGEGPLLLLHDLNQDGEPEGFVLAVPAAGGALPADVLADYSRLYLESAQPIPFSLLVLGNRKGRLVPVRTLPLGEWYAFESFRSLPLNPRQPVPVLVRIAFQTREGSEERLFVFRDAGGNPSCTFTLRRTLSANAQVRDIDRDGTVDLFIQENGVEEGTRYETFLSWYRWNGRCFAEYRTINVVRSLHAFLEEVRRLLLDGSYVQLARWALDPQSVKALEAGGLEARAIVYRVLGLLPDREPAAEGEEVREVLFPEILESPFSAEDERGRYFRLSFRWITSGGAAFVSEATLYLAANPFGSRQFMFSQH